MCLTMGDKGRAYVIILTLTDGLQALSIYLETHEDVIVPPHQLGDTTCDLHGYQGANPLSTVFGAHFLNLQMLDSTKPSQWPNDSSCLLLFPLERLFLYYGAISVDLSPRDVIIAHYFIIWGLNRPN